MKYATAWWGIQILAEDEEDARVLRALVERLPEKPTHDYEHGSWRVVGPDDRSDDVWGFSRGDIDASPIVVEFNR